MDKGVIHKGMLRRHRTSAGGGDDGPSGSRSSFPILVIPVTNPCPGARLLLLHNHNLLFSLNDLMP